MSLGESFLTLLTTRLRNVGPFSLAEHEAALFPIRQLSMLKVMHELIRDKGSQFVIATHSPILLSYPDSMILSLDGPSPEAVKWEDLEHVQVTRGILNNPKRYLHELLGET